MHTVSEVAKLSGVSIRALHHYDEIGLLKPSVTGANGYRYYDREALLRLQQILVHRELGLSLEEIGRVLDAPDFDRVATLKAHRQHLKQQVERYGQLVQTLDETLAALEGKTGMKDKKLFKGFDPKAQAKHEAWLVDRYGGDMKDQVRDSQAAIQAAGTSEFERMQAEVEGLEAEVAAAMAQGLPADSAAVGAILKRHSAWVASSWKRPLTTEAYAGLASVYQDNPDFRARYEARAAGLTDYLVAGMQAYAAKGL